MNPLLIIDTSKIKNNAVKLRELLKAKGIDIVGVTKVVQGEPLIARILLEAGLSWIGDSRVENISRIRESGVQAKLLQIRSPQISQAGLSARYADAALISDGKIAKALANEARNISKKFGVIVMIELGDLREGIMPEDAVGFVRDLVRSGVEFFGIGTNLGCYGGVIPTREKMELLVSIKDTLMDSGFDVPVVSGGATDTLMLFENGAVAGINQLRIGEAIMFGNDTTRNREIPYLKRDTMLLRAEIIEIRKKPSLPYGEIGRDAFGNVPIVEDRGSRLRAIVAIGKQDVEIGSLKPVDPGIEVLGGSGDHLILDIQDSEFRYESGSIVEFVPGYQSVLRLMLSPSVRKEFREFSLSRT
ncbi:MAG: alanine/ornithine racemase family PLP-dependent enzyme [Thermoplasmatales archaeon]